MLQIREVHIDDLIRELSSRQYGVMSRRQLIKEGATPK
jgi:hypothetical protein